MDLRSAFEILTYQHQNVTLKVQHVGFGSIYADYNQLNILRWVKRPSINKPRCHNGKEAKLKEHFHREEVRDERPRLQIEVGESESVGVSKRVTRESVKASQCQRYRGQQSQEATEDFGDAACCLSNFTLRGIQRRQTLPSSLQ
ncbi:hypothetical protein EYF80_012865 [Liparis tanakae]|uniref:Uncharacterized protein n=1 Tax=Liparis tanakae TaxID=230148 RepID=A0A4Z2IHL0_9TELE|nr:hypothetical protein EYF80_012865 [Liparis tanakae]